MSGATLIDDTSANPVLDRHSARMLPDSGISTHVTDHGDHGGEEPNFVGKELLLDWDMGDDSNVPPASHRHRSLGQTAHMPVQAWALNFESQV